jgi:hypothetical protein
VAESGRCGDRSQSASGDIAPAEVRRIERDRKYRFQRRFGWVFNPTTTFLQTCFVEPRVVGTSKTTCACRLRPQRRDFAHANLWSTH